MFIENNVGELDNEDGVFYIELLMIMNKLYQEGIVSNLTVKFKEKEWDLLTNVMKLELPQTYSDRFTIDLSSDINQSEADIILLNYEISKYVASDMRNKYTLFYKTLEVIYPLQLVKI